MTFRKVLGHADEESLLNEEIIRVLLGDTDEVGYDIGDQAEFLDTVLLFTPDVNYPEGVGVLPAVETVNY